MKRSNRLRRHITVTLDLTPEEYEDLATAVLWRRHEQNNRLPADSPWRDQVIAPTAPLAHVAVQFDVKLELTATVLKFIGHEGRPTLAAQYERLNAEEMADVAQRNAEKLVLTA